VDHTKSFSEIRKKRVERQTLEATRLEKRLTKLTKLLASPPEEVQPSGGAILYPVTTLTSQKNQRKLLEQSVVTWEEDASVSKCPFCQQEFGSWTFRRHHCRICGRVVCSDPLTGCSTEVGLNVASRTSIALVPDAELMLTIAAHPALEKQQPARGAGPGQISMDIRMCRDCNHAVFSRRAFSLSISHKPPDQRAYETLRQFEAGILLLMPSFQRALLPLQPERDASGMEVEKPLPTHSQIQEAAKFRKRLIDSFTKYGAAAKRIRDLKSSSQQQLQLQQSIYSGASAFLHTHMLPLKSVPQMLRSGSSKSSRLLSLTSGTNGSSSSLNLSPLRNGEVAESETASQASETSTAMSALETEEKDLRERLVVLEEQRFMVKQMVNSARGARRFEEVSALTRNVEELDMEIRKLQKQVGGVEERWKGLYHTGATA
jgi:hypothetical protein